VRQVGYLLELYRDARSPEYKIMKWNLEDGRKMRRKLICTRKNVEKH